MQKLNTFFFLLLAALSFVACEPENTGVNGYSEPVERINFTLNGAEPIVAAPDEDVRYNFTIAYSNGLASVAASLDGKVIEGSEKTWDDAPLEAEYTFNYTVKGSQFGETLDFVFTATGVDGYTYSVDYALWVTANAVEFTTTLPEDIPVQMYNNEQLSFDISVECGNVLKSIVITKNGEAFASKTDFTTEHGRYVMNRLSLKTRYRSSCR